MEAFTTENYLVREKLLENNDLIADLLLADQINPPFDVHCLAYLELRNLLTAREVWSKQGDWKTWRFPEGLTQKLMLLFSGGWGEDVMAVINPSNIFGNLQPKALIFGFSLEI